MFPHYILSWSENPLRRVSDTNMVFSPFFGNTKLATVMSCEQARLAVRDAWHLNALLLKALPICWRDHKIVNMSLVSDSVCFLMIPTELANKGYETGLQFYSLYLRTLESHHLNMTFSSVTQDPECWTGLNTNPRSLSRQAQSTSKPVSFVLPDLRSAVRWTWSWRKPEPAIHQSQFPQWKG